MKKTILLFSLGLLLIGSVSCDKSKRLTQDEIDDLTFLREEEKLARDVYLFSFDKYGEDIFSNISDAEQKHMDKVLTLLEDYDLPDPASTERGVFNNETLQTLYDDLTAQADISLVEALLAGATIEDLDINDIDLNESRTDRKDILDMYQKLNCGSRNHMRAFTNALSDNGETYTTQYITEEAYIAIINSDNEKCGKQ